MAELKEEHTFCGAVDQVFRGVSRYCDYPDFVPGVMSTQILPAVVAGSCCQVKYEIHLVKSFHYTLDMFETSPHQISWSLADSNLMKTNKGSWIFSEADKQGETRAVYQVEASFRGLVPKKVTDKLAKASLPGLFSGLQKLIDQCS
ncbi:MAG: SRPBCC family protein [Oligoflexales bacterium]